MNPSFRCGLSLLVGSLILAPALFAAVEPLVTVEGSLESDRGRDILRLVITSRKTIASAPLTVMPLGELVQPAATSYSLYLPARVPVSVEIPVHRRGDETLGSLRVAVENANAPLAVRVFQFTSEGKGGLRLISDDEFASIAELLSAAQESEAAERRAATLLQKVLAQGRRPALTDQTETAFGRAWNRLVSQSGAAADPCCCWVPSGNNFFYPMSVKVWYQDLYEFQTPVLVPEEGGYTVRAVSQIEQVDSCGNLRYVERTHTGETNSLGIVTWNIFQSIEPEGSGDPLTRVEVQTPDVGVRVSGTENITLQWQTPSERFYFYSGPGTTRDEVYFKESPLPPALPAPYAEFFRWNENLKSLKRRGNANGISSSYTDYKTGYDSTYPATAAFYQGGTGLVFYGNGGQWVEKWLMAHEFGHHLQHHLQENVTTYGGPHMICDLSGSTQALGEGFADWHGSYYEEQGRSNYYSCVNGECYTTCQRGYLREGNVHAFFWDIFDDTNHATHDQGVDSVTYGQSILNDWAGEYSDFPSFYNDYRDRNIWFPNESVTNQLRTVNQVDVAQ